MKYIEWSVANWHLLLPLAVMVAASLLNIVTRHPDLVRPGLRHLLALVVDLLSVLQSSGSTRGRGLPAKLPLLQTSPPAKPMSRRLASIRHGGTVGAVLCWLAMGALMLVVVSQAGCSTTRSALDGAYRYGKAARVLAEGDAFCRPVLEVCKAKGEYPCAALDRCQQVQPRVLKGLEQLQRTVLVGWKAQALGEDAQKAADAALTLVEQLAASLAAWGVGVQP